MSNEFLQETKRLIESNPQAKAFDLFRRGKPVPWPLKLRLGLISFLEIFKWMINHMPSGLGLMARHCYYKRKFKAIGENCIIGEGVEIDGPENISLSDFVWIDKNVQLLAHIGGISIGRRVHVAVGAVINGHGRVIIENYVGISSNVKIYSHTESPRNGKRLSGPMIPEEMKGMDTRPVIIKKDAFIGTNAVILPGVTIGEGAIVAANSLVTKSVEPYSLVIGVPAKKVPYKRAPVVVEDI